MIGDWKFILAKWTDSSVMISSFIDLMRDASVAAENLIEEARRDSSPDLLSYRFIKRMVNGLIEFGELMEGDTRTYIYNICNNKRKYNRI